MNNTPKFYPNLWGDLQGKLNSSLWPKVTEYWNEGQFQNSFYTLLDYINSELRNKHGNKEQTQFNVPHGSVVVTITLNNQGVEINCPFVDISEAIKIPLLRRVAEINFYPLGLAEIRLNSNQLYFYYTTPLDTCEPLKMYYVLKEICQNADRFDDEFREKFKAKALVEPKVTPISTGQINTTWASVNDIITETYQFIEYFDSKRWYGSSLDFIIIALKRIDLCTQLQGHLKNEVKRVVTELTDNNVTVTDRVQNGRKFLAQIQQMDKDAFAKNLYEAESFVPEKWRGTVQRVKEDVKIPLEKVEKFHKDQNYIGSCIESLYSIYDMFYQTNMDLAINEILIGSLTMASGKSWQDASGILLTGLQTVANINNN